MHLDNTKLAKVLNEIVAFAVRESTDPDVPALIAATRLAIAAPTLANIAALDLLAVKHAVKDVTDPQTIELIALVQDLLKPAPAPAPTPAPAK